MIAIVTSQPFTWFEQFYFEFEAAILLVSFWDYPLTLARPTRNRIEMEGDDPIGLEALRPIVLKSLVHSTKHTLPASMRSAIFKFSTFTSTVRLLELPIFGGKLQQFPIPCFNHFSSFQRKKIVISVAASRLN